MVIPSNVMVVSPGFAASKAAALVKNTAHAGTGAANMAAAAATVARYLGSTARFAEDLVFTVTPKRSPHTLREFQLKGEQ